MNRIRPLSGDRAGERTTSAMSIPLKKLRRQVIVITGATSGIGLTTARLAARRGARLVLSARSENALIQLERELSNGAHRAVTVTADVGKPADVQRISRIARQKFGGFDTWINNAGISIYGKLMDEPIQDMRRLFDTNFWGSVYGSLEAARHFCDRGEPGAIINVGSTVSDRSLILLGMYSASKHAVKGFTDALRMELHRDGAPVSVTLIQPGSIDTPFPRHAKNYMEVEPTVPPPVYAPQVVARTILHCAETPRRNVYVGAGGKGIPMLGHYAPRLTDLLMESLFARQQQTDRPPGRPRGDNGLDRPVGDLQERGDYQGHVSKTSLYTTASLHPLLTGAAVLGTGLLIHRLRRPSPNTFPDDRSSQSAQAIG